MAKEKTVYERAREGALEVRRNVRQQLSGELPDPKREKREQLDKAIRRMRFDW